MKLFVLYVVGSFVLGIALRHTPASTRVKILAGLCLFACIGYFFLHQI